MKTLSLFPSILLSVCLFATNAPPLQAEVVRQMIIQNSPAYEAAANPLRSAPPQDYEFDQAVLADVLRLLAHDAGISYFSLPEDADGAGRLVTFRISTSPFAALETLSKANGVALVFDNGIWYLRPANDKELIGRTYEIKYNALERVSQSAAGGASGGTAGITNGGGNAGLSGGGISLQGNPENFQIEPSELLDDVRELLDLQTTGFAATLAPTLSVDSFSLGQQLPAGLAATSEAGLATAAGQGDDSSQAKVIWNSDANTLYVVATRQQHMWIEGYLASVDIPQQLIALEVKFFESSRDPSEEFGLDWTGTLAGGYNIDLLGQQPDTGGPLGGAGGAPAGTELVEGADIPGSEPSIASLIDLNRIGDYRLPTAILSYEAVNLRIRALLSDQEINAVSYPRMVTLNNREVLLRSVVNQPVLAATSSSSVSSGGVTSSSVDYLPIGTVLNILPKTMADGSILMNISITISNIIGQEIIDGNPYPIATSRVYSAPVEVESGYTVAIGGLDEAIDTRIEQGIPVLGDLPLVGRLFSYKDHSKNKKHLMFFVTPFLIDGRHGGLGDEPKAVVRISPDDPPAPLVQPDGSLVATFEDLPTVIEGLTHEIDVLEQRAIEGSGNQQTEERIQVLYAATEVTIQKLQYNIDQDPGAWQELHDYQWQFAQLSDRLSRVLRMLDRSRVGFPITRLPARAEGF
ncbi:MAG: hypothetical protein AAF591_07545 [Verrucomicrobiota bacterium]